MNAHISDPNVLDPTAQNPQNFELTPAAAPDTEDQEDLVLRFKKPYFFEGETYTEVDLSGLEDLSAADLCKVGKMVKRSTGWTPSPRCPCPTPSSWRPGSPASPGVFPAAARPGGRQAEKSGGGFSLRRGWEE